MDRMVLFGSRPSLLSAVVLAFIGGLVLLIIGVRFTHESNTLGPDARRYLAAARGQRVPFPFALRWLLPALCGTDIRTWRCINRVHLLALPPLTALWLSEWISDTRSCIFGGLLICGLPGIWTNAIIVPVRVDAAPFAWSLGAAVMVHEKLWVLAVVFAAIAGSMKETAPLFASCFAWHPLALIGLVSPIVRLMFARSGEDPVGEPQTLSRPLKASRAAHAGSWFNPAVMLAPWGVGIAAVLASDRRILLMLAAAVMLGYGQLLAAVDTVRLYQWAGPIVILSTATVIPLRYAIAAFVIQLYNPWAGDGN